MDDPIQNIDLPPIETTKLNPLKLLKNPKFLAVIILLITISLLGVLALIKTISKDKTPPPSQNNTTPTVKPTVSQISTQKIPSEFKEKINEIDNDLKINTEFLPPDLDTSIGM